MTEEFNEKDKLLYKYLINDGYSGIETQRRMLEAGYKIDVRLIRDFKAHILGGIDKELREERMMESMLESYERVKLEFEDSINRIKQYIAKFETEDQTFQALVANRELTAQINTALRVIGKINNQLITLKGNTINVSASTDFLDAFRSTMFNYFESMNATYENGKVIFNSPTPEFIDDYNKWVATKSIMLTNKAVS